MQIIKRLFSFRSGVFFYKKKCRMFGHFRCFCSSDFKLNFLLYRLNQTLKNIYSRGNFLCNINAMSKTRILIGRTVFPIYAKVFVIALSIWEWIFCKVGDGYISESYGMLVRLNISKFSSTFEIHLFVLNSLCRISK